MLVAVPPDDELPEWLTRQPATRRFERLGSPDVPVFGSEKEQLLQVIVNVGTFYSLNVPTERRAEVDGLVAELEKARERASSS